jgi:hypothetical protein
MGSILLDSLDYSMSTGDGCRVKECDKCQGMGNSMAVQITRKEDGFLCYCFRCHKSYFFHDKGASPKQVQEITKNAGNKKTGVSSNRPVVVTLPPDYVSTIPPKGLVQMYDLRITEDDIQRHDVGYSPEHSRIIIPVYKYGRGPGGWAKKLVGYQGRRIDILGGPNGDVVINTEKPKWSTTRQADIKHPRFISLPVSGDPDKKVIVVEDVFSAIRISSVGYMAMALLTTYLPYELYPKLRGWDVKIWLDADALDKAVKYQAKLGAHGISASTIFTMLDPKKYDDHDLLHAIKTGGI